MQTITFEVSDTKHAGLSAVANKDGLTVAQLVQRQLDYYTDVVIRDYVDSPAPLAPANKAELSARLAVAKSDYLREIAPYAPKEAR